MTQSDIPIETLCKRLHLANAPRIVRALAERAEREQWSYLDFVRVLLLAEEVAHRQQTRLVRLDGPSMRTRHLTPDDLDRDGPEPARISGTHIKAYVLREQLDRLWSYATPRGVRRFLTAWIKALRWQRLPEMQKLGAFLHKHLDGILAYCRHRVRFGVVEGLNTTIKSILRRARGMRDERLLVLKLQRATAHPIRTPRGLRRFLCQDMHTNR